MGGVYLDWKPKGGEDHPASIWRDMTLVKVPAGSPVAVGLAAIL